MPEVGSAVEQASAVLLGRPPRLGRTRLGVVDGPSGSGKTTFAQRWEADVRRRGASVVLFSSDLLATWSDPFGWFDRFDEQVLGPVSHGLTGRIRLTDWTGPTPVPGRWLDVPPTDVLIMEGVSSGRSALRSRASAMIWVEIGNRAERLERAVSRDGESSRQYLAAWQDDEDAFFAVDRTRARADLVVGVQAADARCAADVEQAAGGRADGGEAAAERVSVQDSERARGTGSMSARASKDALRCSSCGMKDPG